MAQHFVLPEFCNATLPYFYVMGETQGEDFETLNRKLYEGVRAKKICLGAYHYQGKFSLTFTETVFFMETRIPTISFF
ncbi:MAG: hypothetical protein LBS71_02260 [Puniceicoccales bacterium]|jgi:hypothetical protein|nr:hypothetical protein [Puniceicoccales bacterium]